MVVELIDLYYPPLICPDCIHVSRAKLEAEDHLKTKHQGMKLFQCLAPQCQHNYKSKGGLKYHLEHAHQVSSRHSPIKSDIPVQEQKEKPQKRLKRLELSPRLTQLLNDAYSPTTCPACHVEFKKKTHVIHHLVEAHQGQEPYQCIVKECKRTKAYATREGLIYHLMNYHDQ
ncbi:uncharacterized protein B0P05DRAFT_555241 [Gilbertella persicaria]|uniref:uncharacterized protein n=1 Tax=Gilbertella persicaria TaxID=101096 RepID=UPI00221EA584|nr:uncharacterized protein B0P05DRAFT_555241 [Gilbertella persicaria]KAI8063677.1 hypothetical protein B0P05DRAFT_555241 [Gilbertella persicaria]